MTWLAGFENTLEQSGRVFGSSAISLGIPLCCSQGLIVMGKKFFALLKTQALFPGYSLLS